MVIAVTDKGAGKKGKDIQENFRSAPFGWPKDAIDGALFVMLVAGNLLWFLPVLRMLLWPATVLTVLAVWQHNRRLAWWSGIIGGLWFLQQKRE